ncbi:Geranylgeranyl transferase type-1 subunit beta [Gurleya vavrai]
MTKKFDRDKHIEFLQKTLNTEFDYNAICDTSLILYYGLFSLKLLGYEDKEFINNFLKNNDNNFTYNYKNIQHLGNLFSIVALLKSLNKINHINKEYIIEFINERTNSDGTFEICENGESDIRSIYCVLAIVNILDINDFNFNYTVNFILKCQTYEGGFSSIPNGEAHGGYTFCAIASLKMLDRLDSCNLFKLKEFLINRSCGNKFNGRTNKNSDSCYYFWIGSCYKMLDMEIDECFFEQILNFSCLEGGFNSKNGMEPDLQHTFYSLCFLALKDYENLLDYQFDPVLGILIKKLNFSKNKIRL